MTTPRDIAGKLRGLGWDMRSGYSINRGELCSPRAFGHGGPPVGYVGAVHFRAEPRVAPPPPPTSAMRRPPKKYRRAL